MVESKITYTINGKTFDDYDKAIEYKKEIDKKETEKEKLVELILDEHKALSQLLDRYDALNPTLAEKRELLTKMNILNIPSEDELEEPANNEDVYVKKTDDFIRDLMQLLLK